MGSPGQSNYHGEIEDTFLRLQRQRSRGPRLYPAACLKLGPARLRRSDLEFDPQNKELSIAQSTATLVPRRSYVERSAAR